METNPIKLYYNEKLFHDKSKIFNVIESQKRKTKIICTIGNNVKTIVKMIDAGMDVARINSSKGDIKYLIQTKKNLREACRIRPKAFVGVLFTTRGPEIFTGKLKNKMINLAENQIIIVTTNSSYLGDEKKFSCSYDKICESAKIGNLIVLDDDEIKCQILEIGDDFIKCKTLGSGCVHENSKIYLPMADIDIPTITELDEEEIASFVIKEAIDLVAVSFTRSAEDINLVRDVLGPRGAGIKVIAKIDNYKGLQNYEEILEVSDGIMIARGHLGLELPTEKLFLAQKYMTSLANYAGKPIITATHMLESMVHSLKPIGAELTDVANSILDGTDSVLLSAETAVGSYPVEAVQMMSRLCLEAEQCIHYKEVYETIYEHVSKPLNINEAICSLAVRTAFEVNATMIIAITDTGLNARLLAKYRPHQIILALCVSTSVIKQLNIIRGVFTLKIPSFLGITNVIDNAINFAKENVLLKKGDIVVCILGENEETPDQTNILKISIVK